MEDKIYSSPDAGEYANNIQIGDVVVWQSVHGGRGVQTGGIGCVAEIDRERNVAFVVIGTLTATAYDWSSHDVTEVAVARLGKIDVARYVEDGLFGA